MSRKDKEKWARLRREQAKALMVKEPSRSEDRDNLIHNIVGRRRARRYARQNEALAKDSGRGSNAGDIAPDELPRTEEETVENTVTVPVIPQSPDSAGRRVSDESDRAATPPHESGAITSQTAVEKESRGTDHASTDSARNVEEPADAERKNDDMLDILEKHRQVIMGQAETVSKKASRIRDAAYSSKYIWEETPGSSEPVEELPGLLTKKQAEIGTSDREFVNGRGATNGTGLEGGRGAINGTGLVNGTGMINGTRNGGRSSLGSGHRADLHRRWQFLAIVVAIAVIVPSFLFLSYSGKLAFAVDGNFGEWAHIAKFDMQASTSSPELSVQEWAIKTDAKELYLYLKTEAGIMSSSDVDSFYLFIDSDNNPSSGYAASGLGADYMLELHGWNGKVESSSISRYDSSGDQYNWSNWISIDSLVSAMASDRLESRAAMPIALGAEARYLLAVQNNLQDQLCSVSYVVPEKGGALVIRQAPGSGIAPGTGTIEASTSVHLLSLELSCEGVGGVVSRLSPTVLSATLIAPSTDVTLTPGEKKTIDVIVDASACQAGDFVSAFVTDDGVSSTFSYVTILGDGAAAYVTSPPTTIQIDGAFGDWVGRSSPDSDAVPVGNPNINITAVGCANQSATSSFYVSVEGQICQGAYAPTIKGKPSAAGGGNGVVIPVRKVGEDVLRIYIDSDMSTETGQTVEMGSKVIGSDFLIEILGMNGQIVSKSLMQFTGHSWDQISTDIAAAKGTREIELSVPSAGIGGSSSIRFVVVTTDWRSRTDIACAAGPEDPWAINSSGDTYESMTGSLWSSLGAPQLETGESVTDLTTNPNRTMVYAVTNTGRTYRWIIGTSVSWSTNLTDPIAATNVVSIAMYADSGGFILNAAGRIYVDQDLNTTQTWTQRANLGGNPDFADLIWRSGNSDSTASMYAIRSQVNSRVRFTANGWTGWSQPGATDGSSVAQSDLAVVPGASQAQDQIFVLTVNGEIRYSANGGTSWSSRGDLPVPGGGNTSVYVGISIDALSNIWAVTDTGYCFKSIDSGQTFTYTGQISSGVLITGFATPTTIPEFSLPFVAVTFISITLFAAIRGRRKTCGP